MLKSTRGLQHIALTAAMSMPLAAAAQVVVISDPNDFYGTLSFTNPPGPVSTILNSLFSVNSAIPRAVGVTDLFSSNPVSNSVPLSSPTTGVPYILSAQAVGVNPLFVKYNLLANWTLGTYSANKFENFYTFDGPTPANPLTLNKKNSSGNNGTKADFKECVGILSLSFQASCSPAALPLITLFRTFVSSNSSFTRSPVVTGVFQHIAKPSVAPSNFTLHYEVGTDPYLDIIKNEIPISATMSCDVVTPVCRDYTDLPGTSPPCVGNCPPSNLGRIVGRWDVAPLLENANGPYTLFQARFGKYQNERFNALKGETISGPRPFDLVNLVPSGYTTYGETTVRTGSAYAYLRSNGVPATAVANQVTDLKDTFVMDAVFVKGDILFTHYPPATTPASGLNELYYSFSGDLGAGSRLSLGSRGAISYTAWPFDPAPSTGAGNTLFGQSNVGQLRTNYQLPLVQANNAVGTWPDSGRTALELRFRSPNGSVGGGVTPPRPYGDMTIAEVVTPVPLQPPGQTATMDYQYCFGYVHVTYNIASGSLSNPKAEITGRYGAALPPGGSLTLTAMDPTNNNATIFSRLAEYSVTGTFHGVPRAGSGPATNVGELTMTLPKGSYMLKPSVTTNNSQFDFGSVPFDIPKCDAVVNINVGVMLCDANSDNVIDSRDLSLISSARGTKVPATDLRDGDGDGVITPADVKACIRRCTLANCAIQ